MAANQVVKVRRETIAACMTCPLCDKLLRDATTISECLHTFCRKCIYKKISDEGEDCCPICSIHLGCVPLEKLRPDHNLQDVRAKIFPFKRRKVEAPEVAPSVTIPARRKERSLSSLVVSTPKVSTQSTTGRRTKPFARKASALRSSSFSIEKLGKKEEDHSDDCPESSSSLETHKKSKYNTRQNSSSAEPGQPAPDNEVGNGAESWDGKSDLWQPLNCLVEVANRSKSFKSSSQVSDAKLESQIVPNEPQALKSKYKENKDKPKAEDTKNASDTVASSPIESKKLHRIRRKKATSHVDPGFSSQAVLDAAGSKQEKGMGPVWFSLVASNDQEGDVPLPQIPASYLRLKDGNVPVSYIQKYLMKKLNLSSESEVEIKCMGQPVVPTSKLCTVVNQWLQTSSKSGRVLTSVGSSAKDYVMVLAYARKMLYPE
ncbi:hypothetical protein Tsubulata_042886 [Turnera subulata]|uniref:RING-type domain-containing protein n=1 Tax=Turnera subulata TaxID=218843 RepID=A0A9Q0JRQ9_9ROSI|nr:hypothetical protein Tsubulata_042886 [Turnera subulata]